MRKVVAIVAVFAALFVVLQVAPQLIDWFGESGNSPWDYARITQVEYSAEVTDEPNGEGKIIVTERLTFDIHAASRDNLFWELWRDLPEAYIDGVKVGYKVNSVKQVLGDGTAVPYRESPKLYWYDDDYTNTAAGLGPGKWYHSEGPYDEDLRQYECVLFYVDGLYREQAVFEIEYEMSNAALRYGDCSELYLAPYSGETITHLTSFKGQIMVPEGLMPAEGNYEAHTYGTNADAFPFAESDTANPGYHTFAFELGASQLQFRPYNQYIEFTLIAYGNDKHAFTQNASVNDYYNDDILGELRVEHVGYMAQSGNYLVAKIVVLALCAALAALVLLWALRASKRVKKKFTFYAPAMELDSYRDIPGNLDPGFAALLVFCKHKQPKDTKDAYAALLLDLVRKGYVELEKIRGERDWDAGNVNLVVKPETGNRPALSPSEAQYYYMIVRHARGQALPLSAFQKSISADYEYTNATLKNIKSAVTGVGISQGYFQRENYRQATKYVGGQAWLLGILGALVMLIGNLAAHPTRLDLAFGAFFVLGAACLAATVYLSAVAGKYPLLTQFGEDEYARWRGLYNFLNSSTLMEERTVIELAVWEQYLVYATAFGISDKVIAALNVRCPVSEISPGASVMLHSPYYRSMFFYSGMRSFRTAARGAAYTARSSAFQSGFGGHGGYGGGGRGGGGGGGGH